MNMANILIKGKSSQINRDFFPVKMRTAPHDRRRGADIRSSQSAKLKIHTKYEEAVR